jgi:hypothetical protein
MCRAEVTIRAYDPRDAAQNATSKLKLIHCNTRITPLFSLARRAAEWSRYAQIDRYGATHVSLRPEDYESGRPARTAVSSYLGKRQIRHSFRCLHHHVFATASLAPPARTVGLPTQMA